MSTLAFIVSLAVSGLIFGALARLLLPGRDPMTIFQTMMIGIAGSLVAGLVAYYAFDRKEGPGFLMALLFTILLVYAVRKIRERSATGIDRRV
ncbi:MAG: hypothetical protein QOJ38_1976 [Solirubrobacterales bacterium]|jgi:uncharacterized membrane protein YeaQ/YmgE (transglycosylase-associated protein family)|nr:hypothetical protein [Solirubrobacterales bacterium]